MSIVLFKEITTEENLKQLEAEGIKYAGLYVDMEVAKERKFIKDSAALINGLLKKVDRARIDKSKEFKVSVEAEAASLTARLEEANKPFSALIDDYNTSRKAILAEEKRIADAKEADRLAVIAQAERDDHHEMAILMMAEDFRQRAADKKKAEAEQEIRNKEIADQATKDAESKAEQDIKDAQEREQKAEQDKIAAEQKAKQDAIDAESARVAAAELADSNRIAAERKAEQDKLQAIEDEKQRVAAEKKRIDDETARREADTEHKGKINREAMAAVMECGVDKDTAIKVIKAIHKGLIPNVKISY